MSNASVLQNSAAQLDVDLSTIINNYQVLRDRSSCATCAAVVKADAYGLGMERVAPALYTQAGCDTFFVANLLEAISLRAMLKDVVIFVFNGITADQIDLYLEHDIRPILNDLSQVALWNGKKEPCAIHFDTGINRLGLSSRETEQFLNSQYDLNISLMLSHLIQSECQDQPSNKDQLEKFTKIRDQLPNTKASLSNSAGIYLGEEYHFDLLRPGIMLYGGNPGLSTLPAGLKRTFELKAKILQIRDVDAGQSVGYNLLWTASGPSRIALLNVGYADGTLNSCDAQAKVFIAGAIAPVIGKVSMDMVAIDITDVKFNDVTVIDYAEIIGENITLEMVSKVSTLGQYELLTGIGQRFNKKYNLGT